MRSKLQLDVVATDPWRRHLVNANEGYLRQVWCCLQVKLCDPCLSALRTSYLMSSRALYKSTYLPTHAATGWFLPLDAIAQRGLCRGKSAHLSVCPSVTRRYSVYKYPQSFLTVSPAILVFLYQTGWQYSDGDPSNGAVECMEGIWKKSTIDNGGLIGSRTWSIERRHFQ